MATGTTAERPEKGGLAENRANSKLRAYELFILLLLTLGALLIHGYHPWAEDAEIYLPGAEKILHPELFPFNAKFFEAHAEHTLFPDLIAGSVRVTHLPLNWVLFFWQIASIYLLLFACWKLTLKCSQNSWARWAGVALIAALLTIPIAGTALYILDQYTNPRNLVAFATVFAIVKVLDKKYVQAGLFLMFAAVVHTLMSAFLISFCILLLLIKRSRSRFAHSWLLAFPFGLSFARPSAAYHEAARTHANHYITNWTWYEWLGIIGPIFLLWVYARLARDNNRWQMELMCRVLVAYQIVFVIAALVLDIPARLEALARLQPMRSLYLCYVLFFLFTGVLVGEYVLKKQVWRWILLFLPLCAGMFVAQRELFPASAHVEWPWVAPKNPWVQAFMWVRDNSPVDAVFALDPQFMNLPGEDENGFRDTAERSRMADDVKDNGAVSMFPALADEWAAQVQALRGWKNYSLQDFQRLRSRYGVNWVVVQKQTAGLECPYHNRAVSVCRLP